MDKDTTFYAHYIWTVDYVPSGEVKLQKQAVRRRVLDLIFPEFLNHKHVMVTYEEKEWESAPMQRTFEARAYLSAALYERQRIAVTPAARFEVMSEPDIITAAANELGKRFTRWIRRGK